MKVLYNVMAFIIIALFHCSRQSELLLFQSAERPAQAATKDVSRYRLPRMPDHVEDALSRVKGLADVSEDLKRQIVNHIYYDLCSYTL